jgi:iron complex outermembrane receptor protein
LALDGDVYYIQFDNKIQSLTDVVSGQSYETNSGGATYKGLELEANYAFPLGFSAFANYAYNSAVGESDRSNPLYNGHQLTGVPLWTAAAGARFQRTGVFNAEDEFIASLISKFVGSQYVNNASCSKVNNGVCQPGATLAPVSGLIPAYDQVDMSLTYRIANYSIEGQILNVLNTQSLVSMKGKNLLANGQFNLASATINGSPNTNAPEYQVPTSFQITLKAKF